MRMLAVALTCTWLATVTPVSAQQRRCSEIKNPKTLPPPSALVDSARAIAQLGAFDIPPSGMLFSLLYTGSDSLPRIRPIEAAGQGAMLTLAGSLRPRKPDGIWAVRLRVVGGTSPALTLERSTYCAPVPVSGPQGVRRVRVELRPDDRVPTGPRRRVRVVVEVLLSETGDVVNATLIRSSGMRDFDDEMVYDWQTRQYIPALVDGLPVPSRYRTDGQSSIRL